MFELYIYDNIRDYDRGNPNVVLNATDIDIANGLVIIRDEDRVTHYLNNFLALTYKNQYSVTYTNNTVYFYESIAAYNNSREATSVEVYSIENKYGFLVMQNDYSHIINVNKFAAITSVNSY